MKSAIVLFLTLLVACESAEYRTKRDERKTFCGDLLSLRVDDDSEYHITVNMDGEIISFNDVKWTYDRHFDILYGASHYPECCLEYMHINGNFDEWYLDRVRGSITVKLPAGYQIQTFDD